MESNDSVQSRIWMWKTNKNDPWYFPENDEPVTDTWTPYSTVEIAQIEKKYQQKAKQAIFNDYRIDFTHFVQISNWTENRERLVKRIPYATKRQRINEIGLTNNKRLLPTSLSVVKSFGQWGENGIRGFLLRIFSHFNLDFSSLQNDRIRQQMVEKTAEGLSIEGGEEGKSMAQELLEIKQGTLEEIGFKCVSFYTKESFLYRKLNEYLRFDGNGEKYKILWSKVDTLGPFVLFLDAIPKHGSQDKLTVYRSVNFSDDVIDQYREIEGKSDQMIFPAFTSASRDAILVEFYDGNVLLKIDIIPYHDALDVSNYSQFPEEQEMLLNSYFSFSIRSCTFNIMDEKWTIHLRSFHASDEL